MKWLSTPVVVVLAAIQPLWAAPLDRKQLPAETKWFLHLDLDAARSCETGKALRDALLAQPGAKDQIRQIEDATGTDPLTGIRGITIFNTSFEPGVGLVIVNARLDKDRLLKNVTSLPNHAVSEHGRYELHSWTDSNSGRNAVGAIHGDEMIVLGQSEADVGGELDVLDGKLESLSRGKPDAIEPAEEGTIVEADASGVMNARNLPVKSPIVRQSEEMRLVMGEHEGQVFMHVRLLTQSSDVAEQVRSLVEGLRAMVQLQSNQDPQLARLLGLMKVTAEDKTVRVDWSAPAAEIVKRICEQAGIIQTPDVDSNKQR